MSAVRLYVDVDVLVYVEVCAGFSPISQGSSPSWQAVQTHHIGVTPLPHLDKWWEKSRGREGGCEWQSEQQIRMNPTEKSGEREKNLDSTKEIHIDLQHLETAAVGLEYVQVSSNRTRFKKSTLEENIW